MDNDKPVGTLRLRKLQDSALKVDRLAVVASHRKRGVGQEIMKEALSIAKSYGVSKLVLNSQMSAKKFDDMLGFVA